MSAAGICLCFAGVALVPQKWGAGFAMSAAGTCFCFAGIARVLKKLGRRHRHVCCRHLLMLCRHRACPKKCGAGIAMSAAGTCFWFAGIALIWKNEAQAPHPVWGFEISKKGGVGAKPLPTQLQYASKVALYARPVSKRGDNCLHGRIQKSSHL